jgi:hypothetical protein
MDTKPEQTGFENVVVSCQWSVLAADGTDTESTFGYTQFATPQEGDFTAYADLTEETVLGWVWSAPAEHGGVDRTERETALAAALTAKKTPPTVILANPWAPVPPEGGNPAPDTP